MRPWRTKTRPMPVLSTRMRKRLRSCQLFLAGSHSLSSRNPCLRRSSGNTSSHDCMSNYTRRLTVVDSIFSRWSDSVRRSCPRAILDSWTTRMPLVSRTLPCRVTSRGGPRASASRRRQHKGRRLWLVGLRGLRRRRGRAVRLQGSSSSRRRRAPTERAAPDDYQDKGASSLGEGVAKDKRHWGHITFCISGSMALQGYGSTACVE